MLTECWLLFIGEINVGVISKYEIENLKTKQNKNPESLIPWNKNSLFMVYRLANMQRICVSNISLQQGRNIHISLYLQAFTRMAIFNFTHFPKAHLHEPLGSMILKMSSDWFERIRSTKKIHRMLNLASLNYLNPTSEILVGNFI